MQQQSPKIPERAQWTTTAIWPGNQLPPPKARPTRGRVQTWAIRQNHRAQDSSIPTNWWVSHCSKSCQICPTEVWKSWRVIHAFPASASQPESRKTVVKQASTHAEFCILRIRLDNALRSYFRLSDWRDGYKSNTGWRRRLIWVLAHGKSHKQTNWE